MKRLALLPLAIILAHCGGGKEEDLTTIRFPLCDLHLIHEIRFGYNAWASWSPDGGTIAFFDPWDLSFIAPHGGEPAKAADNRSLNPHPNWCPAPGGNKLVYIDDRGPDDYNYTIYTFDLNVGEPKAIKSFEKRIQHTSWSRDGERIVFIQTAGVIQGSGISTIPAGGGYVTEIPNSQGWNNTTVVAALASPARDVVFYIEQGFDGIFRFGIVPICRRL